MSASPRQLPRRRIRPLLVAAAVLVGLALVVRSFHWTWLEGPITHYVTAMTGRPLVIGGDLDVDLGSITRLSVTDVSLGNAPWASSSALARVERVQIDLALRPLLVGRLVVPRIELDRPSLDLERDARGMANWQLGARLPPRRMLMPFGPPVVGELVIRHGTLRLTERRLRCNLELAVDSIARGADDEYSPLVAVGAGRCRDLPFAVSGRVDSPLYLLQEGHDHHIDFSARAGETTARVHGRVAMPLDPDRFDLEAEFAGADLADLHGLFALAMPESPPYALRGWLGRDGSVLMFRDFEGTIGDSEVQGDLRVVTDRQRPFVHASLVARHLDFDDLGVLVGAPPGTGPGETANARQEAAARARAAGSRWLPNRAYDLAMLRSADADARIIATNVRSERLPIDTLDAQLTLRGGVARVRLLNLGLANGDVRGSVILDARRNPIAMVAELHASALELPRLVPRIRATSVGRIGGTARIEGRGNSVAQMLATADGEVSTVMGSGKVSNLALELAGLDVAESLKFLIGRDRAIGLRCAYADFEVADGIARSRSLAFDTTDTVILGEGSVDLEHERFDLVLRPRPKDVSPVSLRGPLEIGGTFKDPSIRPKAGPLVARVTAAAALFAITPPAALLALIETGPGEDVNCGRPARERDKAAQTGLQRRENGTGQGLTGARS